ncbi:MAG: TIR domain-containing protein, partial [Proteobacteria bacterium]|nr:TIR domain-containing protein [Pseudomonadota bacterium]
MTTNMRAFLSHSSRDRGYVESVATQLRPGSFELDSATFDAGLVNAVEIANALNRSDLFCLFLSENSVSSPHVNFETALGLEMVAGGTAERFLVICIDARSFEMASEWTKRFNFVRKILTPESAARLIQGMLVSAASAAARQTHPFVGREKELVELEAQVTDLHRPPSKALYISGNHGSGRRTIASKFFENQFPQVSQNFPTIEVSPFSGSEELYREVLVALRPSMTAHDLLQEVKKFEAADPSERTRMTAAHLN